MSSFSKNLEPETGGAQTPTRRSHPPPVGGPGESPFPGQTGLRRPVVSLVAALILSVAAGIAITRLRPLFVIGAVGCAAVAYIVVTRPLWGLFLYTILYWWRPGELYPALRELRLERVIGVLTLVGMCIEQYQRERRLVIEGTRQTKSLILLVLPVLISVLYAYRPPVALDALLDFLKIVVWYFLVAQLINTRRRFRMFLGLWFACVGKIAFDSLRAYYSGSWSVYRQGITRAIGQNEAGGDPNHLAVTMSATIPILLLLTFYKPLRWLRIPAALGVLMFTLTMALTGSRAGLLGFFAGLIFLWYHRRRRLLVGVIALALIGGGFLLLPAQYKGRYATIGSRVLDGSSQARLDVWKTGMQIVADHPITGVGIGCFGPIHADKYSPDFERSRLVAHSLYVEVLAEVGALGALAFFAFVFEVLRTNRRTRRALRLDPETWRSEELILQGMAAGIFCMLVTGAFGTSFARHTWYIYGALSVAAMRIYADSPLGKPSQGPRSA